MYWGPSPKYNNPRQNWLFQSKASYSPTIMLWVLAYCAFWCIVAIILHKKKVYYVV